MSSTVNASCSDAFVIALCGIWDVQGFITAI